MAFFAVTIEAIERVSPIPDADRIEMATLKGKDFQFVIKKDSFKPGDPCIYFPVDSILPADLIDKMGLTGKLSGKDRNRVKTVKLRGQISQGLVSEIDVVPDEVRDIALKMQAEEFTTFLGVTKYEPPEMPCNDGILRPLPDGQSMYDIEGADRYTEVAQRLMEVPVFVTEKLEGSNFSVQVKIDGSVFVNSRRHTIIEKPDVENMFWKVARRQKVIDFAKTICETSKQDVVIYGEFIGPGVQKNIYGLKEHEVRFFDIKKGGKWVDPDSFMKLLLEFGVSPPPCVPVLFSGDLKEFLQGRTIKQSSNGVSILNPRQRREGIVIRPKIEEEVDGFGRLILKQRSPEYLAENDT